MTDVAVRSESVYYSPIVDSEMKGLAQFTEEQFRPLKGTILVVLAPEITRVGSIDLPSASQERPNYARVAAIPPDDSDCPVDIGDIVVFREHAAVPIGFGEREDLALMNYCEGMESDIMGVIQIIPYD